MGSAKDMEHVTIGLIGLGTVGTGVARILTEHADRIARRAGKRVRWKWAVVRDPAKTRDVKLDGVRVTTDTARLIDDPEVEIVVEAMGGIDPALSIVLDCLAAGKHVVTANKALLAEHGPQIFAQARAAGRAVAFEASVGGGIPIIQALGVALAANQVQNLAAILNGTCNYILTKMMHEGLAYADALAQAQQLGYAEADPTLDVDGTDTAHKLAILTQLAFQATVKTGDIPRQGIDRLQLADLKYAGELGHAVKLLALAKLTAAGLELRVAPTLVKRGTPLAEVRGPYNAIRVVGDAVGDTFFYGRGAGMMPTASAVVGDLIDVVTGRAILSSRVLDLWAEPGHTVAHAPPPDQEPLLPPVHHRRLARRAGQVGADPGRTWHQHRQRHPARHRRRCPGQQCRAAGHHDPSGRRGRDPRRAGRDRPAPRRPSAECLPGSGGLT